VSLRAFSLSSERVRLLRSKSRFCAPFYFLSSLSVERARARVQFVFLLVLGRQTDASFLSSLFRSPRAEDDLLRVWNREEGSDHSHSFCASRRSCVGEEGLGESSSAFSSFELAVGFVADSHLPSFSTRRTQISLLKTGSLDYQLNLHPSTVVYVNSLCESDQ